MAVVAGGTEVVVVAGSLIHFKEATCDCVARVACANIVIIASEDGTRLADSCRAVVAAGTLVAIIAARLIGRELTAGQGVARVIGATIGVCACQCRSSDTVAVSAGVAGGAGIAVIATGGVWLEETPTGGLAAIFGTRIPVIAG